MQHQLDNVVERIIAFSFENAFKNHIFTFFFLIFFGTVSPKFGPLLLKQQGLCGHIFNDQEPAVYVMPSDRKTLCESWSQFVDDVNHLVPLRRILSYSISIIKYFYWRCRMRMRSYLLTNRVIQPRMYLIGWTNGSQFKFGITSFPQIRCRNTNIAGPMP